MTNAQLSYGVLIFAVSQWPLIYSWLIFSSLGRDASRTYKRTNEHSYSFHLYIHSFHITLIHSRPIYLTIFRELAFPLLFDLRVSFSFSHYQVHSFDKAVSQCSRSFELHIQVFTKHRIKIWLHTFPQSSGYQAYRWLIFLDAIASCLALVHRPGWNYKMSSWAVELALHDNSLHEFNSVALSRDSWFQSNSHWIQLLSYLLRLLDGITSVIV